MFDKFEDCGVLCPAVVCVKDGLIGQNIHGQLQYRVDKVPHCWKNMEIKQNGYPGTQ